MKRCLPLILLVSAAACSSAEEEEQLTRVEDFRQRATQYYSAGELDRAEQQARRGLQLEPDNGMLNLILGRTLLRRRDLRSVAASREYLERAHDEIEDWRTALSLGESHLRYAEFLLGEATVLENRAEDLRGQPDTDLAELSARARAVRNRSQEHLQRALPLLEASLQENPEYTFTLNLLASAYAHSGRREEALATLEKLTNMLAESRRWKNRQLALQELEMWQEDQLRENLRADLDLEVDSRGLAATLLMDAGRFAEAEEQFTAILDLEPDLDREYFNRGLARYRQGRVVDAAADMKIFLRKTSLAFDSPQVKRALDIVEEYRTGLGQPPPAGGGARG